MGTDFAQIDSWLVALGFGIGMIAAWIAGWYAGRRRRTEAGAARAFKTHEASLALLGLLLAFTFSVSLGKHDQQKAMVIANSNAIGDFYTCAALLKEPVRSKLQHVIRQYTELQIGLSGRWRHVAGRDKVLTQIQQMQQEMTDLVAEAVDRGTPVALPLINALNELTSMNASRIAAIENRVPPAIVLLLFAAAVFSMVMVGREQGTEGKVKRAGTIGFILLVTLVVCVSLDLNQPARGLIEVSQEPLKRLLASMGG